jgi:outer membrane protein assembly factor BamB
MNEANVASVSPTGANPRRGLRWWPAWLILLAVAGTLIWVWGFYGRQRQDRNLATLITFVLTIPLLLLWWLFLSRAPWKQRLVGAAAVVLPIGLVAALFRINGVTGDLIPVLKWRWAGAAWVAAGAPGPAKTNLAPARIEGVTADFPQFQGPTRDGVLPGPNLARDWVARPPKLLWKQPVGPGWSGFAVAGRRAITMEQRGDQETVDAYDLVTGAPLWSDSEPIHFQSDLAGEGPRATPTVAGGRVFALGATGLLTCLDLETGRRLWSNNIVSDSAAKVEGWGMTSSPLVVDDLVVVSAGGGGKNRSLVAYRAAGGEFAWGGGTEGAGYSSALVATLGGVRQILIFNNGGVYAHNPTNGAVLWNYHWPGGHPHISVPVVLPGDRLLISSGYGTGSELVQIEKGADGRLGAKRLWKSNRLKAKFTNLVVHKGFIYGLDDGIMVCLDEASGALKWKEGRYGHGQELLVGSLILVGAESGEMILLDPDPAQPRELTRFAALSGKTWNPPALAGEYLVVRNDREAACYRLPVVAQ